MAEYTRPFLYPKQHDALFCPERWGLCEASTKSGKTVGCIAWILEQALMGQRGWNYWWVAPVSDQAKIAYTRVKNNLTRGSFQYYESPTPRIILLNGTIIWFKSADNPDSLFGEDVFAAVIDEASRCLAEAWYAVRSTLTATGGPARIIGNVKGRKNWFYNMARRIESGDEPNGHFSRITVLDAIEAGVISQEEIEDAKRNLPESVFRELYMAEAADDGGNPFGLAHIKACTRPDLAKGPAVAFGIDLAKKQDYFVVIGLNEFGEVCVFERWNRVPWGESIRRVRKMVGEDAPALVDSTGLGDPVLEFLQHERGNFNGRIFSAPSKQRLMEGLAVAIQSGEISFPAGRIPSELEAVEYDYTASGVRYTIASDALDPHDDCVMALALARQQWAEKPLGANVMEYIANEIARVKRDQEEEEYSRPSRPSRVEIEIGSILENELTQIYEETLAKSMPSSVHLCAVCGEFVSRDRITDGEREWHPDCAPFGLRRAA